MYRTLKVAWDQPGDESEIVFDALLEIIGDPGSCPDHPLGCPTKTWNGWLCPLLPKAEVDRLIEWQTKAVVDCPELEGLSWDGDVLVVTPSRALYPDETTVDNIEPKLIDGTPYWTPGCFSWTWAEVTADAAEPVH